MPDATSGGGVTSDDGCREIGLIATKKYGPSRYFDGDFTLAAPGEFILPATIAVVKGNAGNHSNTVEFSYSSGGATHSCRYFGLATTAHPVLPHDRVRGEEYGDPECGSGLHAGQKFRASEFTLHVNDGDRLDSAHETRVAMDIAEATPCAPEDAGRSDAEAGSPHDASSDVADAGDANGADASGDASRDAASDGAVAQDSGSDGSVSAACGDGVRGPDEECDLGMSVPARATCSATCEVNDLLVEISAGEDAAVSNARELGDGRHPIAAASDGSFGVAYLQPNLSPIRVAFTSVSSNGIPADTDIALAADTQAVFGSDPVLAELPSGSYVAAFTDLNSDGDGLGIALRTINVGSGTVGTLSHANSTTSFSQYDADVIWDGTEIVVAWTDDSNLSDGPDIKVRTFDASLHATSSELTVAGTSDVEDEAALCTWGSGYAIAWRDDNDGTETIRVQAGANTWSVGPFLPGPVNQRPAIAELDATHLLLVFAQGTDLHDSGVNDDSKISAAVLSTAANGVVSSFDLPNQAFALGLSQDQPNVVVASGHIYAAWRSSAATADPNAEELWLKEIIWSGSVLGTSNAEITLPRWSQQRVGDQRRAALASSPTALVVGWDDRDETLGTSESTTDVVVEFVPVPIFRTP